MQGLAGFFVFEPGKERYKDRQDILSLNQERKDTRIGGYFVLNQERKDERIGRMFCMQLKIEAVLTVIGLDTNY